MRVLFTGGSSPLGARVLRLWLEQNPSLEIWCGVHKHPLPVLNSKVHPVPLDLETALDLSKIPEPIDLVVHFAALTVSRDEQRYWSVNYEGTKQLAMEARARGCRRFVFISTRCASPDSGAYGASKFAAESYLLNLDWMSLTIIRPAEIYGTGSAQGIDRFMKLADDWHVVPLLFGNSKLKFAPLDSDDFTHLVVSLISHQPSGVQVVQLQGPEELTGVQLARRVARRFRALPIPFWWPGVKMILNVLGLLGVYPVAPDQIERATGTKTSASAREETPRLSLRRFLANDRD